MLNEANEAPNRALAERTQADAAIAKSNQAKEEAKAEQQKVDNKRKQLETAKAKFDKETGTAREELSRLDEIRQQIEKEKTALEVRNKTAEANEAHARESMLKAQAMEKEAEKKIMVAQAELKKVKDAIEEVGLKLKTSAPEQRKAAITTLSRLGPMIASTDHDLCHAALCYIIANDSQSDLRQGALAALRAINPELHKRASTLSLSLERSSVTACSQAITELAPFGRAGLPFIAKQMLAEDIAFKQLKTNELRLLLNADVQALGTLSRQFDEAIELLVKLPESPLGHKYHKGATISTINKDVINCINKITTAVGQETRKRMVQYCSPLLDSKLEDNRLLGVTILGTLGQDAKAGLPKLKSMQSDGNAFVRAAVVNAIRRIE